MWDDVIIGKGPVTHSAVLVDIEGDHNISQNNVSFWISGLVLGIEAVIYKDTPEGQQLQKMIGEKKPIKKITSYLDSVVLQHIKPGKLKERIHNFGHEMYLRGQHDKAAQIRLALNV